MYNFFVLTSKKVRVSKDVYPAPFVENPLLFEYETGDDEGDDKVMC
jgi:hypothetical protein